MPGSPVLILVAANSTTKVELNVLLNHLVQKAKQPKHTWWPVVRAINFKTEFRFDLRGYWVASKPKLSLLFSDGSSPKFLNILFKIPQKILPKLYSIFPSLSAATLLGLNLATL